MDRTQGMVGLDHWNRAWPLYNALQVLALILTRILRHAYIIIIITIVHEGVFVKLVSPDLILVDRLSTDQTSMPPRLLSVLGNCFDGAFWPNQSVISDLNSELQTQNWVGCKYFIVAPLFALDPSFSSCFSCFSLTYLVFLSPALPSLLSPPSLYSFFLPYGTKSTLVNFRTPLALVRMLLLVISATSLLYSHG